MTQIQNYSPSQPGTPSPGIYRNVPFEIYLGWNGISNSKLNVAKRSLAHYRCERTVEETPAMRLGTLCHTGKLEPLALAQRYVVMPPFEDQVRKPDGSQYDKPKATAQYRELVETFQVANLDKVVVTQAEFDVMLGVVTSISQHERAAKALTGESEICLIWTDPETGLTCKGRVDCLNISERRIGDLKTTNDASRFESVVYDRGYHRQMSFYLDGLRVLTDEPWFAADLVAVETSAPYCVRSAPLSDRAYEDGQREFRELLSKIKECHESGDWPGYDSPDAWDRPTWFKQDDSVELIFGETKVTL